MERRRRGAARPGGTTATGSMTGTTTGGPKKVYSL